MLVAFGFTHRLPDVTETTVDDAAATSTAATPETTLAELKALVDRGLGDINDRRLMPSGEVADLLLDVRTLLRLLESDTLVN